MTEQRTRAKADAKARKTGHTDLSAYREVLDAGGPVEFTGYAEVERESRVRALLSGGNGLAEAGQGETLELVLDATPFYAEGGGQQPDNGIITVDGGRFEVFDVQSPMPGVIVHRGRVVSGEIRPGRHRLRRDRRRAPAGDLARAHRDAPRAPDDAQLPR